MARGTNPTTEMTRATLPADAEATSAPEAPRRGRKTGAKKRKRAKRGGLSKSHAVAICVEQLGRDKATVPDIQKMLKDQFRIELKSTNISQYKSIYLKKLREGGEVATLDGANSVSAGPRTTRARGADSSNVSLSEIRQLKELAARMGPKGFRDLVDLILE